jgi:ActR/RegA family two-component response regulator
VATKIKRAEQPKILVVDEDEQVRTSVEKVLEVKQVQITTTARVDEALHLIDTEPFDVLLSDLHMTETGDGLAVVSAMHHKNPDALTLVYTGYPELRQALDAILLRSDEASASLSGIPWLPEPIHEKLVGREARLATNEQRVATILERDVFLTIIAWLGRVERDSELTRVPLSKADHRAIPFR